MSGKILLVGFGPGAREHMSVRALEAIEEADVVIGYSTYIKLVEELLDGKEVIRKGMTEELDRAVEAYEQARAGKTVALISSGDIGVYGMAGPTYEVLLQSGWRPGEGIEVEIVPGSTALSSCASLVGAPLTHDFCSISLSDLLTPWPTIARRIEAAARADFVIALYNPKSGRRTGQIVEAQRILLRHRAPQTPVAIVKSAYRKRQRIEMTRLDQMAECDIGMLTTVLIGNSATYLREGLMITPRGYANKYDTLTGATRDGERRGRSLTMGLEGWKGCVRAHLRAHPETSLKQAADHFEVTPGEILDAISAATGEDHAGPFTAAAIAPGRLDEAVAASAEWGRLRAVVRAEAGAVAELMVEGGAFCRRGEWLNIETEALHLHVHWARVARGYLVRRGDTLRGLHFTDEAGRTLFNLSLVRREGRFDPGALKCFEQAWQRLAHEPRPATEAMA